MKQIIKLVQEIGNGGHIYLPKELVGKKVAINLVEKTIEEIKEEILFLLKPYLKHVEGIYLVGSYARGEQTPESDVDVLVITDGKVKLAKRINNYEIISISLEGLERTLKNNAVLLLPFLKEAKTIINERLIEGYKKWNLTKNNIKWYIETAKSSIELSKEYISLRDKEVMPNIVYPLIMRLRGLTMINSLIEKRKYSNKEIDKYLIQKGLNSYKVAQIIRMYREHRDNKKISENSLNYVDIARLNKIVYEYYVRVEKKWEKLR